MVVYVLNVVHVYPDVDGHGYTFGVFSSKKKARDAFKAAKLQAEYYLGNNAKNAYRLVIDEFEIDLV